MFSAIELTILNRITIRLTNNSRIANAIAITATITAIYVRAILNSSYPTVVNNPSGDTALSYSNKKYSESCEFSKRANNIILVLPSNCSRSSASLSSEI
jgi:hypothetical protein